MAHMRRSRRLVFATLGAMALASAAWAAALFAPATADALYKAVMLNCTSVCGMQQRTYWCGPASGHVALHSQGVHHGQWTLAQELGTTTAGTDIRAIPNVLNRYRKVSSNYLHVNRTSLSGIGHVRSIITYAADRGSSAIPCVDPYPYVNSAGYVSAGLPTYSGSKAAGHYVTVRGYDISTTSDRVYYFDPHYSTTHYGARSTDIPRFARCIFVKNWGSQGIVY